MIITLFSLLRKVFHYLSTSRRLSSRSLLWILTLFIPRQCSREERNYFLLASLWCLVRWERPEGWCNSVRSQWKQETGSGVGVLFGCVMGYRLAVLYLPLYRLKYYVHSKRLTNMNYSILIVTIIFNVIIQHYHLQPNICHRWAGVWSIGLPSLDKKMLPSGAFWALQDFFVFSNKEV